jgi:hypothetical protein
MLPVNFALNVEPQNIYWLFSSSAQAISAFIAFLLTGYALVLSMMDNLEQKDETRQEIHYELKKDYYRKLISLLMITGASIILSLITVYYNGNAFTYFHLLVIGTWIFNVSAIIGGILFVLHMVNPDKLKNVAEKIISEEPQEFSVTLEKVSEADFAQAFINLEKLIRETLRREDIVLGGYIGPAETNERMSFKGMITVLSNYQIIDRDLYEELSQISRYRNLVFHGHVDRVEKGMIDRVNTAYKILENIVRQYDKRQ